MFITYNVKCTQRVRDRRGWHQINKTKKRNLKNTNRIFQRIKVYGIRAGYPVVGGKASGNPKRDRGAKHFKKIKLYTNSNNNQFIDTVSKRMRV